jgi:hypothetical protein
VKNILYFLGVEWQIGKTLIKKVDGLTWDKFENMEDLEAILRKLWSEYGPIKNQTKWAIVGDSTLGKRRWWHPENLKNLGKYLINKLKGRKNTNMMVIGWIFINITNESSYGCDKLLGKMFGWKPQGNSWNKIDRLPFQKELTTWLRSENEVVRTNEEQRVDEELKYLNLNVRFHQK